MIDHAAADPASNFVVNLIGTPIRMLGLDGTAQYHSRRLPHSIGNRQPLDLSFLPQDGGHDVSNYFELAHCDCSRATVVLLLPPKNGDDVFDGHDEELVVGLEIDRNRVFRMEEDFVVLPQGQIFVVFDLG